MTRLPRINGKELIRARKALLATRENTGKSESVRQLEIQDVSG